MPNLLLHSCCNVEVIKGAADLLLLSDIVILVILNLLVLYFSKALSAISLDFNFLLCLHSKLIVVSSNSIINFPCKSKKLVD